MKCEKCGAEMYKRTPKNKPESNTVYICSKCDAVVFVWSDGDVQHGARPIPQKPENKED